MTAPALASPRHSCGAKATVAVNRRLIDRRYSAAAAVTRIKGFALTASYLIRCAPLRASLRLLLRFAPYLFARAESNQRESTSALRAFFFSPAI